MRNASGNINPATGGWVGNLLGNQAGGFMTYINIANDGWKVAGNDTGMSYIRGPSATQWTRLFLPPTSVTATELDTIAAATWDNTLEACYGIDIAKTDSNKIYFSMMGYVWKSTDRGATSTRTARAYDSTLAGAGSSRGGRRLVIDPAGTAVVGLGTPAGLYYTTDSGATWTKNTGVATPVSGNVILAYDTASATSGSPLQTQTVYALSPGNGVYKSTTGISGTFSLMSGSPTSAITLMCAGGKPHLAGAPGGDGTIKFFNGTSWTSTASSAQTLCVKPSDSTKMWAITSSGDVLYSSDSGASYTNVTSSKARAATDVPWLAWANETFMSCGDVAYDPTTDELNFAEGIGMWKMAAPTASAALTWTSIAKGISNLVAVHSNVTPTGRIITASHDRPFFSFSRTGATSPSTAHGVNANRAIVMGQMTDYAADNSSFIVGVDWGGTTDNGATSFGGVSTSTDGGATWTYLATQPTPNDPGTANLAFGGNIACGNSTNFVYVPTGDGGASKARPQYTTDGGATWANCSFNATYDSTLTTWHHAYTLTRQIVCADKANPGTFYIFMVGDNSASAADLALKGAWKTTNGGATWTRVYSSLLTAYSKDFWNCKLKINSAGHLTWCAGGVSGYYDTPDSVTLMFSSNGGTSWSAVSGMTEPIDFAWGKAKTGASYQTLYAYGWVSGVRGLYRMDDFNPATPGGTWTLVDRWPAGLPGGNLTLAADANSYGRVVIGSSTQGFFVLDYADTAHGT